MPTANSCLLAVSLAIGFSIASPDVSAQGSERNKQYIYVLRLVDRLHDPKAWTDRDYASVSAHFKRLQEATESRKVILAGRTDEPPDRTFGIVIFEARTDTEATMFMESDPVVRDGVMRAELHPYSIALIRK